MVDPYKYSPPPSALLLICVPVIVALATLAAENLSSSGYYFDSKEVQSSKQAQNEHLSRKLWDLSVTLSGINPAESVASVVAGPPGHQAVNLL